MDRVDRRRFLGYTAVATGSLLASGLGQARPAVAQPQFTEWGWPLPYEQISTKSRQWLQGKGWWPLNAGFIVMWSGEELLGSILMNEKLLENPAVVGTTTGSTNHFGFIAASYHLGLKENQDFTLRSLPPGELATMPKGLDVTTIWEPHASNSVEVLKTSRRLESLNPYYLYSGYYYTRREVEENAPDVAP